jgi:prevent-host-death family protein
MAGGKARTISSTEFHRNCGRVMDEVHGGRQTVIVAAHGRAQVAIISVVEYEELMEARRQLAWTRLARLTAAYRRMVSRNEHGRPGDAEREQRNARVRPVREAGHALSFAVPQGRARILR